MHFISEIIIRRLMHFKGACCLSCHDDGEEGYPMCFINFGKERESEVCCAIANAYDQWIKNKVA